MSNEYTVVQREQYSRYFWIKILHIYEKLSLDVDVVLKIELKINLANHTS